MATSSDRPMEAAREGSGASVSQPHALEGVGEHISNQYVPHTSGSEVENHQVCKSWSTSSHESWYSNHESSFSTNG